MHRLVGFLEKHRGKGIDAHAWVAGLAIAAALRAIKTDGTYARKCREKFAPLAAASATCKTK